MHAASLIASSSIRTTTAQFLNDSSAVCNSSNNPPITLCIDLQRIGGSWDGVEQCHQVAWTAKLACSASQEWVYESIGCWLIELRNVHWARMYTATMLSSCIQRRWCCDSKLTNRGWLTYTNIVLACCWLMCWNFHGAWPGRVFRRCKSRIVDMRQARGF